VASHPHLSDRAIAAQTGLSAKSVAAVRRSSAAFPQSNARVGVDGRARPLNSAEGRTLAAAAIAQHPDAPLRAIAKAAGISLSTAHDVRKRIAMRQDPVPSRYAAAQDPNAGHSGCPPLGPRRQQPPDHVWMLQKLMKDPSLRHSAPGRELLGVLRALSGATSDCAAGLDSVPTHCSELVAMLARACALSLSQVAEELERR
jgi:hypothetical protein